MIGIGVNSMRNKFMNMLLDDLKGSNLPSENEMNFILKIFEKINDYEIKISVNDDSKESQFMQGSFCEITTDCDETIFTVSYAGDSLDTFSYNCEFLASQVDGFFQFKKFMVTSNLVSYVIPEDAKELLNKSPVLVRRLDVSSKGEITRCNELTFIKDKNLDKWWEDLVNSLLYNLFIKYVCIHGNSQEDFLDYDCSFKYEV